MDLGVFFERLTTKGKEWGGYFIMFLGLVLVVYAVIKIVMKFVSRGGGPDSNWLIILTMLLVGGFLLAAGLNGVLDFADVGTKTLQDLATP